MKKEFIFLGPPACGKGTQTDKLSRHLGFPHVDTGSLLRAAIKDQTPDGLVAQTYIEKGNLVPVEIVAKIIKSRLAQEDCKKGYILDGYPRSVEQAGFLEQINAEIDNGADATFMAIYFDIDESILIDRILYRRSCAGCGRIYNVKTKAPDVLNTCSKCGGELIQRADDTQEIAEARMKTYYEQTAPLIEYYEKKGLLKKIDANGAVKTVWNRLLKIIEG